MLRCDLSCLLTSSVKELRLAPHCRSIGRSNVAIIGEQREVARVALRILLPVATASILSLESTAAILPQSPANPELWTCAFRFPSITNNMRRRTAIPFQPQVVSFCSCHRTSTLAEFGQFLS